MVQSHEEKEEAGGLVASITAVRQQDPLRVVTVSYSCEYTLQVAERFFMYITVSC
jgi:hypothetical protein